MEIKRTIVALFSFGLLTFSSLGANPAMTDFPSKQFSISGTNIIHWGWTNVVYVNSLATGGTGATNRTVN